MIRLFELETKDNSKYWFLPVHNRKGKFFTTDKNLKRYIKLNNYDIIQSHVVRTAKDIDYLFFER